MGDIDLFYCFMITILLYAFSLLRFGVILFVKVVDYDVDWKESF